MTPMLTTDEVAALCGTTYRVLPPQVIAKIAVADNGCWLWIAAHGAGGYGMLTVKQVPWRAHRFVYIALVGPIPEGLELDHLCRTKLCVNPAHLEPVTHRENVRRAMCKTECVRGHDLTDPANQYFRPSNGQLDCRGCNREKQRERYAREKAKKS